MMKRQSVFRVTLIIVALVALPALGEIRYTVTDLGTLGGSFGEAYGVNNAGQVVGESFVSNGVMHGFGWDNTDGMGDLGVLTGGTRSMVRAINNNDQAIGWSSTDGASYDHACFWGEVPSRPLKANITDILGEPYDLGTLGGSYSQAFGMNDSSQVVGTAETSAGAWNAFVWDGYDGMVDLGVSGTAFDINESGQIVGDFGLWEDGLVTNLAYGGCAYSINDNGQIVGDINFQATLFDGTGEGNNISLGSLGGDESYALSINNAGQVVGKAQTGPTAWDAFIWTEEEGMVALNDLIAPDSGWADLFRANAISDTGHIVGFGFTDSGQGHAFLLTPVPEPSSIALLALGGWALLARRRA
jgi:probable HAF family extracellular repeat protein